MIPKEVPVYLTLPDENIDLKKSLKDIENKLIDLAMIRACFVKSEAARILGIKRTNLEAKIKNRTKNKNDNCRPA